MAGVRFRRKLSAALSKNCNYGWSFLERVGELLGKAGLAGKATFCGKVSFLGGCSVYGRVFSQEERLEPFFLWQAFSAAASFAARSCAAVFAFGQPLTLIGVY